MEGNDNKQHVPLGGSTFQTCNQKSPASNTVPLYHPLRGLYVTTHDKSYLTAPRGILAHISLTDGKTSNKSQITVTRNFFDVDSERLFLSLCAYGYENLLDEIPIPPSPTQWGGVTYMSKVSHTWYITNLYESNASQVRLAEHPLQLLQELATQLNQAKPLEHITRKISSFVNTFGSHVSIGPFATGGRSVKKVSTSTVNSLDKKYVWSLVDKEFENLKIEDADILSADEESTLVFVESTTEGNGTVEFDKQVCLYGGNNTCKDIDQWRKQITESSLVISGDLTDSNLLPVWDIIKTCKHFSDSVEVLYEKMKDVWLQSQDTHEDAYIRIARDNVMPMVTPIIDVSDDATHFVSEAVNGFPKILEDLQLSKRKQGIFEATTLRTGAWKNDDFPDNAVMWKFMRYIGSLDFRGRKCLKMPISPIQSTSIDHNSPSGDIFDMVNFNTCEHNTQYDIVSSMDVTFAILHCCDPFLRQELLWKITECRLAIPILFPYHDTKVELQLWGLRKVYKSWMSKLHKSHIEASIIEIPLPIVSFIRLGDTSVSKSKLLNKMLGKLQGNNDHPYFVDLEEEPPCAIWSKGTIEAAWYLPETTADPKNEYTLQDAVTFFNLRGNALDFPVQMEFTCQASDVVIILVEEGNYKNFIPKIKELSEKVKKHLVCLISSTNHQRVYNTIHGDKKTLMFSKQFLADVGADICRKLNVVLWPKHTSRQQYKFRSICSLKTLCRNLDIDVDEDAEGCVAGKKIAKNIISSIRQCTNNYKETNLPLRGRMWQNWCKLDKQWNKVYDNHFGSVEHYRDDLREQLRGFREQQRRTVPSADVVQFVQALHRPVASRRYFVAWLNFYLNDLCHENLGPLRKELEHIQHESRVATAEKSKLKDTANVDDIIKSKITLLIEKEISLQLRASDITKMIEKGSLGIEHFVREIGQHYEAYDELKGLTYASVNPKIDYASLPGIAVKLLLDGYPLEILDGEVGQVPVRWIKAVFAALIKHLGDAKVCAISVLGIQSSGKSTLLNCMFGVRFAVSAGRCTRGVFIQLLKVQEDLQGASQCEYVIVIDTEGLKALERCQGYDIRYDNELATFALCLADLTIINIAGQTVGKDMTDVLQIAAHAFIRMKEVHIKSSCRIIQQFVADLGAVDKNKEGYQAILTTLDDAISAAATVEGYSDLYSRFSDVFNLKRNDDVQYIPSLWQGAMAPPNHRYSEKILNLQEVLFSDLRHSGKTFGQFIDRLIHVWNAVKEENFIFSFQTCVAAVQYKIFQHTYGGWVGDMRRAIMEWEANAKQNIKSVSTSETESTKHKLKGEINKIVDEATVKVETLVKSYLSDDVTSDDDQLTKFKDEFLSDLQLTNRMFKQDAREALDRIADSIAQRNQMEVLLPKCKNQLREKAKREAIELRKRHVNVTSFENITTKHEIITTFDTLWEHWMKEICEKYPPKHMECSDVEREFDSYLIHAGQKSDISNGLKERLLKKEPILKRVMHSSSGCIGSTSTDPKDITSTIIKISLYSLRLDIDEDLAYDPQIKHKLIDSAINALNKKYDGVSLTQEMKVQAMVTLCQGAVPIIYEGRLKYDRKYSLRELLTKEKENLRIDFIALCSNAFQDKRASEGLIELLKKTTNEVIVNYLGPAVYRSVLEECPYFASKFAMFGHVLEDMAQKEQFHSYSSFLFDLEIFLNEWTLNTISKVCARRQGDRSFLYYLAEVRVLDVQQKLLKCIHSSDSASVDTSSDPTRFDGWMEQFCQDTKQYIPNLHLPDDDITSLLLFEVKDLGFFGGEVEKYIAEQMLGDILTHLILPNPDQTEVAKELLVRLPDKPHLQIIKHITGCMEQCPICHVPCDNMTRNHDKHRAELHYPEGVIGCASEASNRLVCSICTSTVTTDEIYYDGKNYKKYKDYQKDYPDWIIQPMQNDSPIKYWQWVMNRFNDDFANLYDRREAKIPRGWTKITKQEAIEDLREAYATTSRAEHN